MLVSFSNQTHLVNNFFFTHPICCSSKIFWMTIASVHCQMFLIYSKACYRPSLCSYSHISHIYFNFQWHKGFFMEIRYPQFNLLTCCKAIHKAKYAYRNIFWSRNIFLIMLGSRLSATTRSRASLSETVVMYWFRYKFMDINRVVTFCAFIAHNLFRRDALVWKMHRQIQSYNPCFANKLLSSMYWELHNKLYLNFSSCFCIHLMYMLRTTQCTVS